MNTTKLQAMYLVKHNKFTLPRP